MSVDTAQPAKTIGAHTHSLKIWQYDAARIAHDYVLDVAVSVDKHPHLAMNLVRRFRQLAREFLRYDLPWWDPPLI
jgi:hypothetical protein